MPPTPINPFIALLLYISLCTLQKPHRQAYKFRNSISISLGFCHLRATENYFSFEYETSARSPQQNIFWFKLSVVALLPFMQLKEE